MWDKVVLVEEFGALSGFWDQSLCFADVANDDVTDVGVELLSGQLQTLICPQLLLPQEGESGDLLSSQLHQLSLLLGIAFPGSGPNLPVRFICLVTNYI